MTDRAEAPERVHSAAEEWERALAALALEVPSEVFRGVADKAVAWLAELKVFAAQERDAAVAAALEEAQKNTCHRCRAGDAVSTHDGGKLNGRFWHFNERGEPVQCAAEWIRALPRNDDVLRQHEAKLLREMAERAEQEQPYPETVFIEPTSEQYKEAHAALVALGMSSDKLHGAWGRRVWHNVAHWLRDEAARREGTT